MARIVINAVLKQNYLAWLNEHHRYTSVHIREDGVSLERTARHFDVEEMAGTVPPCTEMYFDDNTSVRDALAVIVRTISTRLPPKKIAHRLVFFVMILFGCAFVYSLGGAFAYSLFWVVFSGRLMGAPVGSIIATWVAVAIVGFWFAIFLFGWWSDTGPLRGYEFDLPSLFIHGTNFFPKKSLLEYGFQSGDLVVVDQKQPLPGALGFWADVGRDRRFWSGDFHDFMYRVISEDKWRFGTMPEALRIRDRRGQPRPPCVGAVVCYTEDDWAVAAYVRQNFASLHVMSGLLLTLYVFEDTPLQQARSFWQNRLRSTWFQAWSALGLTCSKPYPSHAVYHFCDKIGVEPDQLPCVVVFQDWRKVMTEREVVPITGEIAVFFRRLCSDIRRSLYVATDEHQLESHLGSSAFWDAFSARWRAKTATNPYELVQSREPYGAKSIHSVFLCHSSTDRPFVDKLARDLRTLGLSVWLDKWEIRVGDSIVEKLETGIEENDYIAIILSPASVSSRWVRKELNAAFIKEMEERKIVLLPILYQPCKIPRLIRDKLYADFTSSYESGMEDLLKRFRLMGED